MSKKIQTVDLADQQEDSLYEELEKSGICQVSFPMKAPQWFSRESSKHSAQTSLHFAKEIRGGFLKPDDKREDRTTESQVCPYHHFIALGQSCPFLLLVINNNGNYP